MDSIIEILKVIAEIVSSSWVKTAIQVGGLPAIVLVVWMVHAKGQNKLIDRLIRGAEAREAIAFGALNNNTEALTALKTFIETRLPNETAVIERRRD